MVEKNMLIGALATGLVDAALEGYYAYNYAQGKNLHGQFPYYVVPGAEWLPPTDDLLASAGVPLLLYAVGKFMKKPTLVKMSKGGAIYGVSSLVGGTTLRLSWMMQNKPLAISTYRIVR